MAPWLARHVYPDGRQCLEFPIACQSCLGPIPHLRMIKANYGKDCMICTQPFTVFEWKPVPEARSKKTIVCQMCSNLKNVCQVCLRDLGYGLPVQVRDTALGINSSYASITNSIVTGHFFAEEHDHSARAVTVNESSFGKAERNNNLLKHQRPIPFYQRNRSHVCSFYQRGQCARGATCAYRHEMLITGELSKQGINDPVALKILQRASHLLPNPPTRAQGNEDIPPPMYDSNIPRLLQQEISTPYPPMGSQRTGSLITSNPR